MSTRFTNNFNGCLEELEIQLCLDGLDYVEKDMDIVIKNVKERIMRQYNIEMNNLDKLYNQNDLVRGDVQHFLNVILSSYCQIAGCAHTFRYLGEIPISLMNIRYLGLTRDSLINLLRLLQIDGGQSACQEAMERVKVKLPMVKNCIEKKLFMLLIVSFELKLHELTALLAELLYLGGVSIEA